MSSQPLPDSAMLDQRIAQLETMYAHLERDFQTLNTVVTEQAAFIERLERRIDRLMGQLDRVERFVEDRRDPLDEKPPHY